MSKWSQYQQQLAAIVAKDPNVEAYFSSVGVGGVGLDRQYRPYFYETQAALRAASGLLRERHGLNPASHSMRIS